MIVITTEQSDIFRYVNEVTLSALVGLFGIFSNIVNMIVFYKQGFTTTVNISFFALAVSDFLCLVTMEWYHVCSNPYWEKVDISFIPKDIQYLTGGWFHVSLGRVTSWITVYITAERCLSVALPLKVKQIVSPRKTTVCMCAIFVMHGMMLIPEYCIAYMDWKFVPHKNRTLYGLVYRRNTHNMYGLVFVLCSASGMLSFVAVIILTTFLAVKLAQQSDWYLKMSVSNDNSNARATRDKKTMKMVVMIASILIVCYIPGTTVGLVTSLEPGFMIGGKYQNAFFAFWSVAFLFNAINSSVNVLLYYSMSTKYRETFRQLFRNCMKDYKCENINR